MPLVIADHAGPADGAPSGVVGSPRELTVREIAARLGVSPEAVRRQIRSGALPARNVQRWPRGRPIYRVAEADIERLVRACPGEPTHGAHTATPPRPDRLAIARAVLDQAERRLGVRPRESSSC